MIFFFFTSFLQFFMYIFTLVLKVFLLLLNNRIKIFCFLQKVFSLRSLMVVLLFFFNRYLLFEYFLKPEVLIYLTNIFNDVNPTTLFFILTENRVIVSVHSAFLAAVGQFLLTIPLVNLLSWHTIFCFFGNCFFSFFFFIKHFMGQSHEYFFLTKFTLTYNDHSSVFYFFTDPVYHLVLVGNYFLRSLSGYFVLDYNNWCYFIERLAFGTFKFVNLMVLECGLYYWAFFMWWVFYIVPFGRLVLVLWYSGKSGMLAFFFYKVNKRKSEYFAKKCYKQYLLTHKKFLRTESPLLRSFQHWSWFYLCFIFYVFLYEPYSLNRDFDREEREIEEIEKEEADLEILFDFPYVHQTFRSLDHRFHSSPILRWVAYGDEHMERTIDLSAGFLPIYRYRLQKLATDCNFRQDGGEIVPLNFYEKLELKVHYQNLMYFKHILFRDRYNLMNYTYTKTPLSVGSSFFDHWWYHKFSFWSGIVGICVEDRVIRFYKTLLLPANYAILHEVAQNSKPFFHKIRDKYELIDLSLFFCQGFVNKSVLIKSVGFTVPHRIWAKVKYFDYTLVGHPSYSFFPRVVDQYNPTFLDLPSVSYHPNHFIQWFDYVKQKNYFLSRQHVSTEIDPVFWVSGDVVPAINNFSNRVVKHTLDWWLVRSSSLVNTQTFTFTKPLPRYSLLNLDGGQAVNFTHFYKKIFMLPTSLQDSLAFAKLSFDDFYTVPKGYHEKLHASQTPFDYFGKKDLDAALPKQLGFQDPATPTMEGLIDFHHELVFFMILISAFVFTFLLFIVFKFKNKSVFNFADFIKPSLVAHNTVLEIIWTIVPGLILFAIAVPSFALLYAMDEVINPGVTLKAIGHQWYWSYEYGDPLPQFRHRQKDVNLGSVEYFNIHTVRTFLHDTQARLLIEELLEMYPDYEKGVPVTGQAQATRHQQKILMQTYSSVYDKLQKRGSSVNVSKRHHYQSLVLDGILQQMAQEPALNVVSFKEWLESQNVRLTGNKTPKSLLFEYKRLYNTKIITKKSGGLPHAALSVRQNSFVKQVNPFLTNGRTGEVENAAQDFLGESEQFLNDYCYSAEQSGEVIAKNTLIFGNILDTLVGLEVGDYKTSFLGLEEVLSDWSLFSNKQVLDLVAFQHNRVYSLSNMMAAPFLTWTETLNFHNIGTVGFSFIASRLTAGQRNFWYGLPFFLDKVENLNVYHPLQGHYNNWMGLDKNFRQKIWDISSSQADEYSEFLEPTDLLAVALTRSSFSLLADTFSSFVADFVPKGSPTHHEVPVFNNLPDSQALKRSRRRRQLVKKYTLRPDVLKLVELTALNRLPVASYTFFRQVNTFLDKYWPKKNLFSFEIDALLKLDLLGLQASQASSDQRVANYLLYTCHLAFLRKKADFEEGTFYSRYFQAVKQRVLEEMHKLFFQDPATLFNDGAVQRKFGGTFEHFIKVAVNFDKEFLQDVNILKYEAQLGPVKTEAPILNLENIDPRELFVKESSKLPQILFAPYKTRGRETAFFTSVHPGTLFALKYFVFSEVEQQHLSEMFYSASTYKSALDPRNNLKWAFGSTSNSTWLSLMHEGLPAAEPLYDIWHYKASPFYVSHLLRNLGMGTGAKTNFSLFNIFCSHAFDIDDAPFSLPEQPVFFTTKAHENEFSGSGLELEWLVNSAFGDEFYRLLEGDFYSLSGSEADSLVGSDSGSLSDSLSDNSFDSLSDNSFGSLPGSSSDILSNSSSDILSDSSSGSDSGSEFYRDFESMFSSDSSSDDSSGSNKVLLDQTGHNAVTMPLETVRGLKPTFEVLQQDISDRSGSPEPAVINGSLNLRALGKLALKDMAAKPDNLMEEAGAQLAQITLSSNVQEPVEKEIGLFQNITNTYEAEDGTRESLSSSFSEESPATRLEYAEQTHYADPAVREAVYNKFYGEPTIPFFVPVRDGSVDLNDDPLANWSPSESVDHLSPDASFYYYNSDEKPGAERVHMRPVAPRPANLEALTQHEVDIWEGMFSDTVALDVESDMKTHDVSNNNESSLNVDVVVQDQTGAVYYNTGAAQIRVEDLEPVSSLGSSVKSSELSGSARESRSELSDTTFSSQAPGSVLGDNAVQKQDYLESTSPKVASICSEPVDKVVVGHPSERFTTFLPHVNQVVNSWHWDPAAKLFCDKLGLLSQDTRNWDFEGETGLFKNKYQDKRSTLVFVLEHPQINHFSIMPSTKTLFMYYRQLYYSFLAKHDVLASQLIKVQKMSEALSLVIQKTNVAKRKVLREIYEMRGDTQHKKKIVRQLQLKLHYDGQQQKVLLAKAKEVYQRQLEFKKAENLLLFEPFSSFLTSLSFFGTFANGLMTLKARRPVLANQSQVWLANGFFDNDGDSNKVLQLMMQIDKGFQRHANFCSQILQRRGLKPKPPMTLEGRPLVCYTHPASFSYSATAYAGSLKNAYLAVLEGLDWADIQADKLNKDLNNIPSEHLEGLPLFVLRQMRFDLYESLERAFHYYNNVSNAGAFFFLYLKTYSQAASELVKFMDERIDMIQYVTTKPWLETVSGSGFSTDSVSSGESIYTDTFWAVRPSRRVISDADARALVNDTWALAQEEAAGSYELTVPFERETVRAIFTIPFVGSGKDKFETFNSDVLISSADLLVSSEADTEPQDDIPLRKRKLTLAEMVVEYAKPGNNDCSDSESDSESRSDYTERSGDWDWSGESTSSGETASSLIAFQERVNKELDQKPGLSVGLPELVQSKTYPAAAINLVKKKEDEKLFGLQVGVQEALDRDATDIFVKYMDGLVQGLANNEVVFTYPLGYTVADLNLRAAQSEELVTPKLLLLEEAEKQLSFFLTNEEYPEMYARFLKLYGQIENEPIVWEETVDKATAFSLYKEGADMLAFVNQSNSYQIVAHPYANTIPGSRPRICSFLEERQRKLDNRLEAWTNELSDITSESVDNLLTELNDQIIKCDVWKQQVEESRVENREICLQLDNEKEFGVYNDPLVSDDSFQLFLDSLRLQKEMYEKRIRNLQLLISFRNFDAMSTKFVDLPQDLMAPVKPLSDLIYKNKGESFPITLERTGTLLTELYDQILECNAWEDQVEASWSENRQIRSQLNKREGFYVQGDFPSSDEPFLSFLDSLRLQKEMYEKRVSNLLLLRMFSNFDVMGTKFVDLPQDLMAPVKPLSDFVHKNKGDFLVKTFSVDYDPRLSGVQRLLGAFTRIQPFYAKHPAAIFQQVRQKRQLRPAPYAIYAKSARQQVFDLVHEYGGGENVGYVPRPVERLRYSGANGRFNSQFRAHLSFSNDLPRSVTNFLDIVNYKTVYLKHLYEERANLLTQYLTATFGGFGNNGVSNKFWKLWSVLFQPTSFNFASFFNNGEHVRVLGQKFLRGFYFRDKNKNSLNVLNTRQFETAPNENLQKTNLVNGKRSARVYPAFDHFFASLVSLKYGFGRPLSKNSFLTSTHFKRHFSPVFKLRAPRAFFTHPEITVTLIFDVDMMVNGKVSYYNKNKGEKNLLKFQGARFLKTTPRLNKIESISQPQAWATPSKYFLDRWPLTFVAINKWGDSHFRLKKLMKKYFFSRPRYREKGFLMFNPLSKRLVSPFETFSNREVVKAQKLRSGFYHYLRLSNNFFAKPITKFTTHPSRRQLRKSRLRNRERGKIGGTSLVTQSYLSNVGGTVANAFHVPHDLNTFRSHSFKFFPSLLSTKLSPGSFDSTNFTKMLTLLEDSNVFFLQRKAKKLLPGEFVISQPSTETGLIYRFNNVTKDELLFPGAKETSVVLTNRKLGDVSFVDFTASGNFTSKYAPLIFHQPKSMLYTKKGRQMVNDYLSFHKQFGNTSLLVSGLNFLNSLGVHQTLGYGQILTKEAEAVKPYWGVIAKDSTTAVTNFYHPATLEDANYTKRLSVVKNVLRNTVLVVEKAFNPTLLSHVVRPPATGSYALPGRVDAALYKGAAKSFESLGANHDFIKTFNAEYESKSYRRVPSFLHLNIKEQLPSFFEVPGFFVDLQFVSNIFKTITLAVSWKEVKLGPVAFPLPWVTISTEANPEGVVVVLDYKPFTISGKSYTARQKALIVQQAMHLSQEWGITTAVQQAWRGSDNPLAKGLRLPPIFARLVDNTREPYELPYVETCSSLTAAHMASKTNHFYKVLVACPNTVDLVSFQSSNFFLPNKGYVEKGFINLLKARNFVYSCCQQLGLDRLVFHFSTGAVSLCGATPNPTLVNNLLHFSDLWNFSHLATIISGYLYLPFTNAGAFSSAEGYTSFLNVSRGARNKSRLVFGQLLTQNEQVLKRENQQAMMNHLKGLDNLYRLTKVLDVIDQKIVHTLTYFTELMSLQGLDQRTVAARYHLTEKELLAFYNFLQFQEITVQLEIISRVQGLATGLVKDSLGELTSVKAFNNQRYRTVLNELVPNNTVLDGFLKANKSGLTQQSPSLLLKECMLLLTHQYYKDEMWAFYDTLNGRGFISAEAFPGVFKDFIVNDFRDESPVYMTRFVRLYNIPFASTSLLTKIFETNNLQLPLGSTTKENFLNSTALTKLYQNGFLGLHKAKKKRRISLSKVVSKRPSYIKTFQGFIVKKLNGEKSDSKKKKATLTPAERKQQFEAHVAKVQKKLEGRDFLRKGRTAGVLGFKAVRDSGVLRAAKRKMIRTKLRYSKEFLLNNSLVNKNAYLAASGVFVNKEHAKGNKPLKFFSYSNLTTHGDFTHVRLINEMKKKKKNVC